MNFENFFHKLRRRHKIGVFNYNINVKPILDGSLN